jgi:hypothetical protein
VLTVATWRWGDKYDSSYVDKVARGFKRYYREPHRFVCLSDDPRAQWNGVETLPISDPKLLQFQGCFARLRMFDPAWQAKNGITERLVCIDLDVVITGPLDPLFDRTESFVILQGANAVNPCPYNGSLWMLRAGAHGNVWADFSMNEARKIPFFQFPDDQGWMWQKIPNAAGWRVGNESGVYAFRKPGWQPNDRLPSNARVVCFPGSRDPKRYAHLPWIIQHWR